MENLVIDPEFRALIPPLSKDERAQLEANILRDGILDPLKVWREGRILLDGHNRYEIAMESGLEYEVAEVDIPDREAAKDWIDRNQLGRRNLTKGAFKLISGRCYNRAKQPTGGDKKSNRKNCGLVGKADERIGREFGVSPRTAWEYGQLASSVEALSELAPGLAASVIDGSSVPSTHIIKAAKVVDTNPDEAKAILGGSLKDAAKKKEVVTKQQKAPLAEGGKINHASNFIKGASQLGGIVAGIQGLDHAAISRSKECAEAVEIFKKAVTELNVIRRALNGSADTREV